MVRWIFLDFFWGGQCLYTLKTLGWRGNNTSPPPVNYHFPLSFPFFVSLPVSVSLSHTLSLPVPVYLSLSVCEGWGFFCKMAKSWSCGTL